ncbi:hypothetical protein COW36_01750 [bacterium (Candidatus Blackallbacteria) CG17_big_fil_post_rev_8_21_14_2_50_48_46]|uniref:Bacterial type II secretion system protein E domain-containing protein n=1 Tax=bacterium (Candidatus Blackallbacteria) CG17_big_fil_post_rev_8_21_14_2_50_48_46 TaxID=2014261 RepID=A0A2M7GAI6_9BACT|nr:MAG: hypothetical protein COW64_26140 [bacterium (Candidatus Blackallbacteria) CG18_big_fil_WC_8_21_14_2_50_49_26]PIW19161.1 MAG: hypothetical protein COW36_01750 [bacterium (Candidatus Blackallbacteria) CG17_big_fil_post_rev_8_21_14_2_50_48_46]PIW45488.1 MAG: hypothetical protein COW20_20390 [bacterium (Candidatus Blackallbacteria) CG13_big_fil_rev_8_21_14_2_50_49_14]
MSDIKKELKLGELLVREGYIPIDAIQKVLEIQREYDFISNREYKPFGQICVELKLLSSDELQAFLKKHRKSILLGELLMKMRALKAPHLEKALELQEKEPERRLGEILLSMNLISENQLIDAISIQLDIPKMLPALELMDVSLLRGLDPQFVVKNAFLPIAKDESHVTVVMEDPQDEKLKKYLRNHFQCQLIPAIAPSAEIRTTLKAYYTREIERAKQAHAAQQQAALAPKPKEEEEDEWAGSRTAGSSPFSSLSLYEEEKKPEPKPDPKLLEETLIVGEVSLSSSDGKYKQEEGMLNYLIKNALLDQASAIHIEPQDKYLRVRYRINGVLNQKTALPQNLGMPMLARLKQVCALNAESILIPQRNRVQAKFNEREFELGIATYPSTWGENMVLNIRQKQGANTNELLHLERIGLTKLNLRRLQKHLGQAGGLIIVTGPPRSGKSTTEYAALNYLNLLTRSIVTAENPVELVLTGVAQGNWTPERGITFPELIQSMGYMDPDILMVSEIDSPETLEATVDIALSGAKVITAYPSFDTMGALLRLASQGLESYLIASSNIMVVSQRLVRKLCPSCKVQDHASREYLDIMGLTAINPEDNLLHWPKGCPECNQIGYVGQTALHEILVCNETLREAILEHKPAATIREIARMEGKLVTMAEDGYYKAVQGVTSLAEIQRVAFINEFDTKHPWEAEKIMQICNGEEKSYL